MAVTSIWRVNGWLGKVVVYVENPEKTANPEFYENEDTTEQDFQGLDDVIAYAVNSRKTKQHKEDSDVLERFVSGVNCHPATARAEMLSVKKRFWVSFRLVTVDMGTPCRRVSMTPIVPANLDTSGYITAIRICTGFCLQIWNMGERQDKCLLIRALSANDRFLCH